MNEGRYVIGLGEELLPNEHYNICTLEEAVEYLDTLDELQVDSETEGFDPHTKNPICFQLGNKEGTVQFLFAFGNPTITAALKQLLEKEDVVCVFQNAQFDLRFLRKQNIKPKKIFDIFLAECVLTAGMGTEENPLQLALDDLVLKYTGNLLNKQVRGVIHKEGLKSSRVIIYACEDVKYMSIIKEKQIEQLTELDLLNVMDLENEAVKAFAALSYNGIKIDQNKWKVVAEEVQKLRASQEVVLDNIVTAESKLRKFVKKYIQGKLDFGIPERVVIINWASPKQKLDVLQTLISTEIDSTGDRILQKNKKKHKLVAELIKYNKLIKLESSFGMKFLKFVNPATNRVHPQIWQILSTGRISVSDPNLNQIPSKGELATLIRSCFIAEEGNSIVGGDYSGMELRIIAEFSGDPVWVNAFKEGKDLHSVLCSMTFGVDEADVKKPFHLKPEMSYRDIQKTINFGLAYGMSEFKLSDTMDVAVKVAKDIITKFFKKVPKVKQLLDKFGNLAKQHGRIRTAAPFRRIRWFPEWEFAVETKDFKTMGEIERAGKNTPIQGTNGDIIKLALSMLQNKIDAEDLPVQILLSVYDEIQCECPDDMAEEWKEVMNDTMIKAAQVVIKDVPIVVDCKISKCWKK